MSEKQKPDYDKMATVDECDELIEEYKNTICKKAKQRGQIKDNRKDAMKAYNDELKECEEELDHALGVLDELKRHKKLVEAGVGPKAGLKSV